MYTCMDTNTDHFTPLVLHVRDNYVLIDGAVCSINPTYRVLPHSDYLMF